MLHVEVMLNVACLKGSSLKNYGAKKISKDQNNLKTKIETQAKEFIIIRIIINYIRYNNIIIIINYIKYNNIIIINYIN